MATNPFDEFQPATPANPFDEFAPAGPTTQQVLHTAVKVNPDDAAEVARLSKRYPAPNDVLLRNLQDVKLREVVDKADESLKTSVKLSEYMRTSPFVAQQAHDDLGVLAALENFATDTYGSVKAGGFNASKGAAGVFRAGFELVAPALDFLEPVTEIGGNPLRRLAEGFAMQAEAAGASAKAAAPKTEGVLEGGFQSGVQSLSQNLLTLPLAFLPGGQPAALAGMTAFTGGGAYQDARAKGLSMQQALPFAASQAAIEYATEKLPLSRLIGDVKAGTPVMQTLLRQIGAEIPGEQVATVLQDLNEWAVLNPEKPFNAYLAERPNAAAQTLIATIVGAGGNVAVAKGIEAAVSTVGGLAARMDRAEAEAQTLQEAMRIASQSKLRERNPETFRDLARTLTEGSTVFVDAQSLAQSATELAQALPDVAEQLEAAIATNSTIEIPVADILTLAPGTPLEQLFLQNARTEPTALSLADVEAQGAQAEEFIRRESERVMQQAQDQQAWQASSEAVRQTIQQQLNDTGRFTSDVNEAYATLQSNFFSTMAARVGITPQELYERYSLKVAQQMPGRGNVLNTGRKVGEVEVVGYHFSKADRTVVTTAAYGTGLQGSGRETYLNATDKRLAKRAYFYFDKGTGINPESGVGGRGHKARLTNIYDSNADPLRLKQGRGQLEFESAVLDAGFSGYLDNLEGTQSGQVILLGPRVVEVERLGNLGKTTGEIPKRAVRGEGKGRDKFVDQLVAHKFGIAGEAGLGTWSMLVKRALPEAHEDMLKAGVFEGDGRLYKDGLIKRYLALTEIQRYDQAAVDRLTSAAVRGERATGTRSLVSAEEKAAIKESADKVGVSVAEITRAVREHKLAHPVAQGWAPLVYNRTTVEKGKVVHEYKASPYTFSSDKDGAQLEAGTAPYTRRVNAVARSMVDEVRRVFTRATNGDKNAQNILAQAGWYKAMRSRLRQEFGGLGDLFADLLGATSPNTPVRDNWANAVDSLRRASRGDFDTLIGQWEAWADNADALDTQLRAFVNTQLALGLTKKAIKALPEYKTQLEALKAARVLPEALLPTKESGKKYGFNGRNVARAMVDLWRVVKNADPDVGRGGTAPKALNFSGNLIGFRERATIDVWAARMLQRLAGGARIPSMAETGVSGEMREDGSTTLQFGFGQDVFGKAVQEIRRDAELKTDKTLAGINDDDLQAVVWFVEKELWTVNNWTNAAGEGGSFELEANLSGPADQAGIQALRKTLDSSKSKPAEKAQARKQLAALERSVDRYVGGLSIQMSADTQGTDFVPTDADMARLGNQVRTAIYEADDGNTVLASKALSTEGRYGGVERSVDLEVVAREGYNPNALWLEMLRQAQAAKQDSTFLSRVLRDDEAYDPARHRPGVEIYFREAAAQGQLEAVLADLAKEGVEFLTVIVDGRRLGAAVEGEMPPAVGVRLQYVPEFEQRYGMDELASLDDAAIAAKIEAKASELRALAERVTAAVDGVSFAGQFWYDTQVAFSAEYQEKIDGLTAGVAEESTGGVGVPQWAGQSVRQGVESANRQARETAGGEPDGGTVLGGDAPVLEQGALNGRAEQAGDGAGRAAGAGAAPLQGAPVIEGATGPDPRLVAVAEQYARDNGIELKRQADYVQVDPERAARIAAAYEAMAHAPLDPQVQEAYANLIQQTVAQYRALEAAGYKFWFIDPENDPYKSPWDAMREMRAEQTMGVFPTVAGFGSGATDVDITDNPLMGDTGIQWPYGSLDGELKPVLANDLFRAVHDAFGHGLEGAGFRAQGEENAWQAHVRLFTGSAVAAITSETRGQNSWLNFGPYGESNRTARVEDTVFADQKTGLMPEWTWTEGRAANAADSGVLEQSGFDGFTAGAEVVNAADAARFPFQTGAPVVLEAFHGTGFTFEAFDPGRPIFTSSKPAVASEYAVGREPQVQKLWLRMDNPLFVDARGASFTEIDTRAVPGFGLPRSDSDSIAAWARSQGYDGVIFKNLRDSKSLNGRPATPSNVYVGLVPSKAKGAFNRGTFDTTNPDTLAQSAVDQTQTPEFQAWFGDSKVVDTDGKPLVVYHGRAKPVTVFNIPFEGAYFTTEPSVAEDYATYALTKGRGTEPNVTPVYLSIRNPRVVNMRGAAYSAKRFNKEIVQARFDGNDGILFRNVDDSPWGSNPFKSDVWVAFTPTQIKSAIGNVGTFDPQNPSILNQGPRGTFNPQTLLLTLNENADLSTFLHESGHFFLEVLADIASQPDAPQQVQDDMAATLKWFGVPDLATWNSYTLDQKRPYHEKWAESFEQYLFEGKAPSAELQPLFRRFRSWMVNVYKSLTQFMRGRNLKLGDDVRQVFDRLIATDEQIAQTEQAAGLLPDFDATNEAIEKLQARSLRDLKWTVGARNKAIKALQKQAAELRKGVEAGVRAEVEQQPVYAARKFLRTDTKLSIAGLESLYMGEGDRYALLDWKPMVEQKLAGKEGVHPDIVADMFGFASGDQLVRAILDAEPINEVIQGLTDQRMLERHGDLVDQRAIEEAANEAVHNEARARSLASELKSQSEMLNARTDTGNVSKDGRKITVNAITAAAKEFAANLATRRRIKDLKNAAWQHRSAEARAGKAWQDATAKGDTQAAVQAKRDQVLNNAAAKALQDAQAETRKILEFFKRVAKGNDEKVVKGGRDPDVVNAMRAILGAYDIAPRLEKAALEYMETVSRNDPAMFAALQPSVQGAINNAKPLPEMTMEELRGLHDELRAMWVLAKRSRQMEIDGDLMDRQDLADVLVARMDDIGIPDVIPGERAAITDREEAGIKLQFAKSILSRVEQWAERLDGKFGGPFLRYVFQPIKEAADNYRTARVGYRKRFTALVENVGPAIRPGAIPASEIGYTFGNSRDSGQAELLHAILHTGNDSNKRKLLLGRGWATENPDGTLDTTQWDAFLKRMINEGKLEKAHYDFAQGVWDLLEEMKPLAQETHRNVFGRYFAEVTSDAFETPFGSYRGGYVPAQTDGLLVRDAKLRELAEGENETMAYAFPAAPSGFTKGRVEYNKPLLLDLRALAQHIDKVLLFSYMQGPVTDVRRLLTDKGVSYALDRLDPGAYEGMLIPWLNRSARQIVETPVAGDRKLSRFLSAARSRAGMALMFANLSNTVQQVTGFSMAAVKVKPSLMLQATGAFVAGPKQFKEQVATASEFMRNRMLNEVGAMNDAVEQILVDATRLEKAQAWTNQHAYFLQSAVDNAMSPIIWTAAYNQAIGQQMDHKDAVRFADGVIRQTQGSSLPEDISRFESGSAIARTFTQFVGYFNMMANTNATAAKQVIDEVGLRKGAGKLLGVALAGLLVPIWVAEAIAQGFRGGPDDEDDDGYLDDWLMAVFGLGTLRGMVAQVPIVGQMAQLAVNRFNDNPADDRFSLSPAVSLIESAVSSPASVYKAIVDEGSAQKAVRDVAAAATLLTGLPVYGAVRPLGYLAGVADERIEPTGPVDFARGLVTGTASPDSKQP